VVNFADGDSTPTIVTIPIANDTLVEPDETVNLTLGSPTGATIGTQNTATLNIVDNDILSTLQFSAPTFSVNEDGTPIAAVTVTRTGGSAGSASATVNLSNGTATAGADYNATPIVVNFADGDSTPTIVTIPIANDTLVEPDETVNLTLGSPTGATIGTQNTATLNIVDNDILSTLQFSAPTFSVNEDGTPIAAVTVTRTGGSAGSASATVNLSNGTATAGADYDATPIVVNFADGDSTPKIVTIPIANDTLVEPDETVNLSLGSPTGNASIGTQNTATLNIVDDESSLQFSSSTFSVNEDGTPIAAVTVTRTGGSAGAASATVNLSNGTATAAVDYDASPIVVNFADGDSAPKTVTFPIGNDSSPEPNETVNLTLGSPTGNASIGTPSTATFTIVDDDPLLQFSAPTFSVREDGTVLQAVTVTRTGSTSRAVSATVTLSGGTATPAVDYNATPIVVSFASGDFAPKVLTFPIANDTLAEDDETINLSLGSPTGNALIGFQSTATFTILNDDPSPAPIANLSAASIVGDSITDFGLASAIDSNKVSNVGPDGIPLQGGNTDIENNDITNANISDALTWGGIALKDFSLFGGSALPTVDMLSNFITNSFNGVAIASAIDVANVMINYNDLLGGTGPNRIAGVGASLDGFNLFPTSV
jgi:hypothetical protein